MRTVTLVRRGVVLAIIFAGPFAMGRCSNGNMVTSPMATMTPAPASTPTPAPTPAGASPTYLYGHVVDAATGDALADVHVVVTQRGGGGGLHSFQTGADGAYKIDNLVPYVETVVFATKSGYIERPNTLRPHGATPHDIAVTKYRSTPGKTEYAD